MSWAERNMYGMAEEKNVVRDGGKSDGKYRDKKTESVSDEQNTVGKHRMNIEHVISISCCRGRKK